MAYGIICHCYILAYRRKVDLGPVSMQEKHKTQDMHEVNRVKMLPMQHSTFALMSSGRLIKL